MAEGTSWSVYDANKMASREIYGRVLALSFALTLCFFSGLPNALHIYLLTPLFFLL